MGTHGHIAALICVATALVARAENQAIPANIDKAFADYVALPNALLPILEEVKDKATADTAAEKLYAELPKIYDARNELQKIAALPPSIATEVKQKYEKDMRTRWGLVYNHIFRLQKVRCYDSLPFFKQFHTLCMMLEQ